ncbi:dipeptidase [Nocardia stercoris]|uniref:Dipeptidase n=1 Tax=Nocardia stercoris TaxID=2483361 RepID=A0A3M2KYS9_9NOCA|nr:dipeptidase [Nocardia stercoris]RMI29600.1 dipeptidase [Nocardia stercoris]
MTGAGVEQLRSRVKALMPQAESDLRTLVAMRSVADPRQFPPQECRAAAQWTADAFAAVGLTDAALYDTADGSAAVVCRYPAPAGAPTVLLYCHYDVQPPLDEAAWTSPVWALTERDGRWYGRGAADCKGNLVMHLTALRALRESLGGNPFPVGITLVAEGAEEIGGGGLEQLVRDRPDLLRADTVIIGDAGNFALGVPTLTETLRGAANLVVTVETLRSAQHSGSYGGAAPDALTALIQLLSTLHDEHGNTTIDGMPADQRWTGVQYPQEQFRADAEVLDGVSLIGGGTIADQIWARPAVIVIGIDAPPVIGSANALQPSARARLNLRVPPGQDTGEAVRALVEHLHAHVPWQAKLTVEPEPGAGEPFRSRSGGPARAALEHALRESYGRAVTTAGQGGSIPLCTVLADTYPEAEIMLIGVEEPGCLIHAPNESVDPSEIEHLALAEALFLANLHA